MDRALARLVEMQYQRTPLDLFHGSFRVRGDVLEILPAYEDRGVRVEYFGDEIERIVALRSAARRGARGGRPARGLPQDALRDAEGAPGAGDRAPSATSCASGSTSSSARASCSSASGSSSARASTSRCSRRSATATASRTTRATSRAAPPGEPPPTLIDYFPDDFLLVVDESHQTIPQVRGMYHGDRSRKQTLVDYGFRLPSALDNRPLTFEEFDARIGQRIYVSATPGALGARARRRRGRRAAHPADRAARPGDRGAPGARPGRRPARRDPRGDGARRARAGDHAHQAHGGGADPVPARSAACGCATCTATSRRSSGSRSSPRCAAASSTCWSASTCCARGSTCPRSRWWRSSTPTRRASCAARPR